MRRRVVAVVVAALVVPAGCDAFSSSGEAPGAPPAPDAGPADGAATGDGSSAKPGCAALAEPVVTDGGESARCDPNGPEAVLATSKTDCGSCGHACTTVECTNGMCWIPDLTTALRGAVDVSGSPLTGLYMASRQTSCAQDGGSSLQRLVGDDVVTVGATTGECWGQIAFVDDQAFLATSNGVRQGPRDGFDGGTLVPFTKGTANVAATRGALYWVVGGIPTLYYLPKGAPSAGTLGSSTNFLTPRIATDPDAAYWALTEEADAAAGATVHRRGDDGSTSVLYRGLPTTTSIALDAEYLYFGTTDGRFLRAPKSGAGEVVTLGAIASARPNLVAMVVDDAWIYAVGSGAPFPDDKSADVWRLSKCGGRATRIGFFAEATMGALVDLGGQLSLSAPGRYGVVHRMEK